LSFLGSVGTLIKGSGIEEAMQTCYRINTVTPLVSGMAIERAARAHCLVESALTIKLLKMLLIREGDESGHIELERD
jgi:hypothetical protein